MLIHAAICWPAQADSALWPMAIDYALDHHNHMPCPSTGMLSPLALLQHTNTAHTHFKDMHVWGCPAFVLEPFPKWKNQSCCSLFVGFSPHHPALVPLILNPQTGKISPQFHVVFDDWFTSVLSVGSEDAFDPSTWQDLFTTCSYQHLFDENDPVTEFRQPIQVQSLLEMPGILVQLGRIQHT